MKELLKELAIEKKNNGAFAGEWLLEPDAEWMTSYSPIDGQAIAQVSRAGKESYEAVLKASAETFDSWRRLPAPMRGEIVRQVGNELRRLKEPLGKLVTLEMGKILPEGEGEIQEAIDIADFAVGLSRQLYGKTMHSERPEHRMYEQWHPLGNVGVITAFNFPAAVWAWNSMLAAVCGDITVWKPADAVPLTAIAITKICERVTKEHGYPALFPLLFGRGSEVGQRMCEDRRFPLISATGSCRMGRMIGETVGKRLGRSLLELGGNNALIVMKDADLDLALRAVVFGAVGTAGQRCTTTRRLLLDKEIEADFIKRLVQAYKQIPIGNPLEDGVLMGPLVNEQAVMEYKDAIAAVPEQKGEILYGGKVLEGMPSGLYVEPTIVKAPLDMPLMQEETFAPILYVAGIKDVEDAVRIQNDVVQGLSSAIFTNNLQSAEYFLSQGGSDCGIANVNIGTSGAEIGGAFGGEKDTGGGREAGSDSWKIYMRRQTNTINWGKELPLAQGISFG